MTFISIVDDVFSFSLYVVLTIHFAITDHTPALTSSLQLHANASLSLQKLNFTNDTVYIDTSAVFFTPPQLNLTNDTVYIDTPAVFFTTPQLNIVLETCYANHSALLFAAPQLDLIYHARYVELTNLSPTTQQINFTAMLETMTRKDVCTYDVYSDPYFDGCELMIDGVWTWCRQVFYSVFNRLSIGSAKAVQVRAHYAAMVPLYVWLVLGSVCVCLKLWTCHRFLLRVFPVWYPRLGAGCMRQLARMGAAIGRGLQCVRAFVWWCIITPVKRIVRGFTVPILTYAGIIDSWCVRDPNEIANIVVEVSMVLEEKDVPEWRLADYQFIFTSILNASLRTPTTHSINGSRVPVSVDEFFQIERKILLIAVVEAEQNWAFFKGKLEVGLHGFLSDSDYGRAVVNLLLFTGTRPEYFERLECELANKRHTEALLELRHTIQQQEMAAAADADSLLLQAVVLSSPYHRGRTMSLTS